MQPRHTSLRLVTFFAMAVVSIGGYFLVVQPDVSTPPAEAQQPFDRAAMVENITLNVAIPAYDEFVERAKELDAAAQAFQNERNDPNLIAVQQAWRAASLQWSRCEVISLGFVMFLQGQINTTPANIEFIEEFIASADELTVGFISGKGSSSKGLSAIEYLVFYAEYPQTLGSRFASQPEGVRRMDYLVATTGALVEAAEEVRAEWDINAEVYTEDDDISGALLDMLERDIANELIASLDLVLKHIGDPLGRYAGGDPRPELVTSPYASYSVLQAMASLEGIYALYIGGEDGLGFDDYLDAVSAEFEDEPLSEVIGQQFETVYNHLLRIGQPLTVAVVDNPEIVDIAFEELRTLLRYMRVDMFSELSIALTFNDNDGD